MKIAFNPSNSSKNVLDLIKDNKDIVFDLKGHSIYTRGVEFKGTDTWRPIVDNLTSNSATSSLSANQGRVLAGLINGKSNSDHNHDDRYLKLTGGILTGNLIGTSAMFSGRFYGDGNDEGIIIKPSSNGYAGLILGTHDGERSIFYFVKDKPFWRYSHGSDNLDIIHPKKSGIIALTSDIPSSLKNPYALTISLNGASQGPYDGSAAKNINITPGSIGAATSDHNHDGRYVYNYGGIQMDGVSLNKNALGMATDSGINKEWWHILQAAWNDEYRWNSQIAFPTQNRNGMYYRSGLDDNTNWGSWVKLLDTNNYSSILDSRYYTESEVNSLLDGKLNRQNLSDGTWNPRGYNLAAEYSYNGGDLSISESGSQIHVSIDGYFWQNEGQYRVLDTSDMAGLISNFTVHQYLSDTDSNWWPLIWGGSSHNNTSDSTGAVYKSYDALTWQTSSQTLYATHLRTTYIDLENDRGIFQVTSEGTSPLKGIQLPDLESNGIGMFSKLGNGSGADEGGIIISADTSVIYNSFDTGWGLSVRDKDRGQTDISGENTIAFGVRQDYKAYSLGGFEKSGSNNSYVLLGGGGHKLESALNVASAVNADTVDGYHATDGRTFTGNINWSYNWNDAWSDGTHSHPWYGFDHRYPNTGTYSTTISDYYGMTIKTGNSLRLDCANLLINGIIDINNVKAQIRRGGFSQQWVKGRDGALLRETSISGYHALWSLKTTDGSWDFGEYNAGSSWNNIPVLSYITDSNYNSGNNVPTYQIKFPLASGTVALTSDILNLNYYWANVKISTYSSTTTSPTVHTLNATRVCAGHNPEIDNSISCSNWFRSSGSTGWYNTTYHGGWYMSDTSWIRAHNGVGVQTSGQIRAGGFCHGSVNSNNYILLAGGGYKSFGGNSSSPIFLGYLDLNYGNDGTVSSSFSCLGYSVPFTYTRGGGNYCRISIPDTDHQTFYIQAATASVNYSGGGMDTWVGNHRGSGAWWLHCYASGYNEVRVKGFRLADGHNDSWWGGNPLWHTYDGANKITVCIFGYVVLR